MRALFVVLVVLALLFSLWAHFAAPCTMFKWGLARDVPVRCLVLKN